MTDWRTEDQVTFADLGLWSGRMSPEHSVQTEGKTSKPSLKKSLASSKQVSPICVKLSRARGQNRDAYTTKWEPGALLGEYTTRSFGESPSEENASRLSQILEDSPLPKYSLSEKACTGILNRAERRGKELLPELKAALEAQAGLCPFKRERESQGGGKGILIQNEHTGALSTLNNQSVYSIQGNTIDRDAKQNGSGTSENVAHTLNGIDKHGVTYGIDQQGGKGSASYTKDIAPTLAGDSHGTPHGVAIPINTMVATRDTPETRTTFGVGEPDDPQFTISAAHEHAVFIDLYNGSITGETAPTLNASSGISANHVDPTVATIGVNQRDDNGKCLNSWDVQSKHIQPINGVAEPLYAGDCRYGGGESYVLVAESKAGQSKDGGLGYAEEQAPTLSATPSALEPTVVVGGFSYGQSGDAWSLGYQEECSPAIRGSNGGNQKPVVFAVDCRNGTENECINGTLQAKEQGQNLNSNNVVRVLLE